ncbi:MAG: AsmA family protein [Alphaproteobacteria bacterium]|nr:AsmA family protein [Alphaproteobacteria bacterium]
MRWFLRLASVFVLLAIITVSVFALIPTERIANFTAREISARTGRKVTISGKIKPVFFPVLGIRARQIKIANADWSDTPVMLSAKSLLVGVDLGPLLTGTVKIRDFRLEDVDLRLERSASGQPNWQMDGVNAGNGDTTATSGLTQAITLDNGRISNATISYVDHQTGTRLLFENVDINLNAPDLAAKASLTGAGEFNGERVEISASVAKLNAFLSSGISPLELTAKGQFGKVELKGRAGLSPAQAEIEMTTDLSDISSIMRLVGLGNTSSPALFKRVSGSGKLVYTGGDVVFLRGGNIQLDDSQITGEMDLTLGTRPKIKGKLIAQYLDLKPLFSTPAGITASASSNTRQKGWSKTPFDLSGLGAVDADIAFMAPSIYLGFAKLGATQIRMRLQAGRMVVNITKIEAYDGVITGKYVLNTRKALSMSADIKASGVKLQPLLVNLTDFDRLIATGDMSLGVLTSGNSIDAMMQRLSGSGKINIGAGEFVGLDLVGMLRNLDASYRGAGSRTIFSSITGSFSISGGVLNNKDLKFVNPIVTAAGDGQIGLGTQTLTYRITPVAFRDGAGKGGISVPVLLTGPWSKIKYEPDLKGLFNVELQKQRDEAVKKLGKDLKRAQNAAEKKLRNQVDSAVKKGADKVIGDAIKRLMGGN